MLTILNFVHTLKNILASALLSIPLILDYLSIYFFVICYVIPLSGVQHGESQTAASSSQEIP